MKILKIIGITMASIIGLFLIVAFFLPSEFTISRSIEISKPADSVYVEVADFNRFVTWNPWKLMDPNSVITINGEPATIGSIYTWNGTITGNGSMANTALVSGQSIEQDLVFLSPFESKSTVYWTFEPTASGTKATWSNKGKLDYPVARYFGLGMDKMLGGDFEKGLSNLKKKMESGS